MWGRKCRAAVLAVVVAGCWSTATARSAAASSPNDRVCYDNSSNSTTGALFSTNYAGAGLSDDDSAGAVDLDLGGTRHCKVNVVTVRGEYFNGSGTADSVDVDVYANRPGQPRSPGDVLYSFRELSYSDPGQTGTLTIRLPQTLMLGGRVYWFSVAANMSGFEGWAWLLSSPDPSKHADEWQNPGDGMQTGCRTWTPVGKCYSPGSYGFEITLAHM